MLNLLSEIHILLNFSQVSGKLACLSHSLKRERFNTVFLKCCSTATNHNTTFTDVAKHQDFMLPQRRYLAILCLLAVTVDWKGFGLFIISSSDTKIVDFCLCYFCNKNRVLSSESVFQSYVSTTYILIKFKHHVFFTRCKGNGTFCIASKLEAMFQEGNL